ncbi:MAG: peptidoglycan-binding protein [Xanthobacteraceae bacterium]
MLDTFELPLVQSVEGAETEALTEHSVPALEGDFLQDLGRRAARIRLAGVATGTEAGEALKTLREKHRAAAPISFVADIGTATKVDKVLIEQLDVREFAGRPERFAFSLELLEFVPAPTPTVIVPPPPPPPPDPKTAALEITVVVDDDPTFDVSKAKVSVVGTADDGANFPSTPAPGPVNGVWSINPIKPGSYTASATLEGTQPGSTSARVPAGPPTRVQIHLRLGPSAAKAFVVHYWFDRAFIEPCLRRVLRDVDAHARAHPDEKILIVGHTDHAGPDDYNQSLSERRARGVYAYLTSGRSPADHDAAVDEWDRLRKQGGATNRLQDNWGVREYQHLLAGLGLYGGQIDEKHGPLTDAAVRNFQADHALGVDGIVGDATWRALIDAYLSGDALQIPEERFLPNCADDHIKWLGSGEQDAVRNVQFAWRPNRRTEIVFVKADALPGKVPEPVTFALPNGKVNPTWCAGGDGENVVILSRVTPKPNTFFVEPIETDAVTVRGVMTFEDGTPAGGMKYVLIAPDGEILTGERSEKPKAGTPLEGTTNPDDGSFSHGSRRAGLYILSVSGPFTVRLKDAAPNSGTSPTVCTRLDGSKNLDVVLAAADGIDPRLKLNVTVFGRLGEPRANTEVSLAFPDGSTTTATTDADGHFSTVMAEPFPTVKMQYAASEDPADIILLRDYFIDVGDIATTDGVSRRLSNLGFLVDDDLAAAIATFQGSCGIDPTGVADADTQTMLSRVYNGDVPLVVRVADDIREIPENELQAV